MRQEKALLYKVPTTHSPITKTINGQEVKQVLPRVVIPYRDEIIKDGQRQEIRYISGAKSIYVEEQIKAGFPRDRQPSRLEKQDLTMEFGTLNVFKKDKPMLVEYLDAVNYNGTNPDRLTRSEALFVKYQPEVVEQEEYDSNMKRMEAQSILYKLKKEDGTMLRKLGQALLGGVDAYEDMEIVNKLMRIAQTDPDKILSASKVAHNDVEDVIAEAERLGAVKFTPTKAEWSTGEAIVSYKIGSDAKEKLKVHLSKSENSSTLSTLRQVVKDAKMKEHKQAATV